MTAPKMAGLYEVRRTLKDGTEVLQYRVKITRKTFKVDKLFNADELQEAIELINASKSITGKSKIKLLEEQKKKESQLISDFLKNPTMGFFIDKYIEIYIKPKFQNANPDTPEGKFKLRNLKAIESAFKRIKEVEINKRAEEKWDLSPAIIEALIGKQKLKFFKPSEITEIEINEFIQALLKEKLKPLSVQRYLTHLSNVFRKLKHIDPNLKTLKNPCLEYDKDLLKVNGNMIVKKPFRFTEEEKKRLFEELENYKNPEMKWIIQLMLMTGLRRSEVILLKWSQVKENSIYLEFTKSGRPRNVYLIPQAKELLNSIPKQDGQDRIFSYSSVSGFEGSLSKFLERIGMKETGSHIFRKESISMFIEMIGAENSILIAELLGIANTAKLEEQIEQQQEMNGISNQNQLLKSIGHSNSSTTIGHYFSFKK